MEDLALKGFAEYVVVRSRAVLIAWFFFSPQTVVTFFFPPRVQMFSAQQHADFQPDCSLGL